MRAIMTALLFATVSVPAFADEVVAESDTGMVFGDLDCQITDMDLGEPRFSADMFDYLSVTVAVETECVRRDGTTWSGRGQDTVIFPTPTFDWASQSWVQNGMTLATKVDFRTIEVNPELEANVWSYMDETHVAFKVQLKQMPE